MSFASILCALVFCLIPLASTPQQQSSLVERSDSQSGDLADPSALSYILERLARVAELYEGQALSFIALEEIRDRQEGKRTWLWRKERTFKFEYIYGTVDEDDAERAGDILPGVYMDYRRKAGGKGEELAPDEIVEKLGLAALVSRGFSFPVGFRRSVQSLHRYEIVAQEEVFDRPAVVVSIEPLPPHRLGLNNWYGRAWIDSETYLPLKFELFEPEDFTERSKLLAAERGEGVEGEYTFTTMTALFEIVQNGMRFPSQITQERRMVNLRGLRSGRERSESEVFLVTQTYSEYRFFNIRTEEEIHEMIFGGTARVRIKKE
jgi:hypothetical protein